MFRYLRILFCVLLLVFRASASFTIQPVGCPLTASTFQVQTVIPTVLSARVPLNQPILLSGTYTSVTNFGVWVNAADGSGVAVSSFYYSPDFEGHALLVNVSSGQIITSSSLGAAVDPYAALSGSGSVLSASDAAVLLSDLNGNTLDVGRVVSFLSGILMFCVLVWPFQKYVT